MFPPALNQLIEALGKIPTIGPKSAQRFALHLAYSKKEDGARLLQALTAVTNTIHDCTECHTISDEALCSICKNTNRDKTLICVVASPQEVESIERSGTYRGVYHVLHGLLNQMEDIGPDDLTIKSLATRVASGGVKELIIAVSPTVEGEITAHYLTKQFSPTLPVTRIARGLPIGAQLEYMDDATIAEALRDRR